MFFIQKGRPCLWVTYALLLLGIGFVSTPTSLSAQSIQPAVIASSGAIYTTSTHQLDGTAGEPLIETYTTSNQVLTEGFHQPNLTMTALTPSLMEAAHIEFWPNPTQDLVHLSVPDAGWPDGTLTLTDSKGTTLLSQPLTRTETQTADLSGYAVGTYFLRLITADPQFQTTLKIQKIQ